MGRKTADGRRALRTGEYQRKSGTFEFKYKDADGRIVSISAKTLDELRAKEAEAIKDRADGIRSSSRRDTLNDWFDTWDQQKLCEFSAFAKSLRRILQNSPHPAPRAGVFFLLCIRQYAKIFVSAFVQFAYRARSQCWSGFVLDEIT